MPTNRKVTGGIATTFELVCSHPPLESPGHHATEQLQFVNLGTPRNRGTAPFDEGLVLAQKGRQASAAGDARLNRRCRAPPHHPPKSSCHQSCLVFNVVFVCLLCPSKKWSESHRVSWNSWSKRGETWRFEKDLQTIGLIVTGIGIELCKESGCSTSWFLIFSQILDVRWLFIILTFSSALWQFNKENPWFQSLTFMMCILYHLITFSSLKKKLRVARSPGNQAATSGTADPAVSKWVPFESWQLGVWREKNERRNK